VSGEIRKLRLIRVHHLLMTRPAEPVTKIAFACGFDVLVTCYQVLQLWFASTAPDVRNAPKAGPFRPPVLTAGRHGMARKER
jgi:transcriptional regulator GlxA family with amidase domain